MYKNKKIMTAVLSLLAVMTINGCGSSNSSSDSKKDNAKSASVKKAAPSKGDAVSIKSGEYISPAYEKKLSDDKKYVALKLHIKNNGVKQDLMTSSFNLKDGAGNKTKAKSVLAGSDEFETLDSEKLSKGDSVNGYVVFPVETNKKYTLEVAPTPEKYDKKIPTSKVEFNTKGYKDQAKQAQTALTSYVDSIFLNKKEGNLNYDKLIANKMEDEKVEFRKQARSVLESAIFTDTLQDEASLKIIEQIQAFNAKKSSVKYEVESVTPTSAEIKVTPTVVKLNDLSSEITRTHNELEDAGEIDPDTSYGDAERSVKEAVIEKLPEILEEMPVREAQGQNIKMTKDGKKWKVDVEASDSAYSSLAKAFGGYVY